MKQATDKTTRELPAKPKPRGRPPTGNAMTAGERKAKQRAALGLTVLSVELPSELVEQLNDYLKFKGTTKSAVLTKLLTSQLLRKR